MKGKGGVFGEIVAGLVAHSSTFCAPMPTLHPCLHRCLFQKQAPRRGPGSCHFGSEDGEAVRGREVSGWRSLLCVRDLLQRNLGRTGPHFRWALLSPHRLCLPCQSLPCFSFCGFCGYFICVCTLSSMCVHMCADTCAPV